MTSHGNAAFPRKRLMIVLVAAACVVWLGWTITRIKTPQRLPLLAGLPREAVRAHLDAELADSDGLPLPLTAAQPRRDSAPPVRPAALDILNRAICSPYDLSCSMRRQICLVLGGRRQVVRLEVRPGGIGLGRRDDLARRAELIRRNYTRVVDAQDTIAGRRAWVLRLEPHKTPRPRPADRRPWKQLWIDSRTFVVLASRDWSSRNQIKRSMRCLRTSIAGVDGEARAEPLLSTVPGRNPGSRLPLAWPDARRANSVAAAKTSSGDSEAAGAAFRVPRAGYLPRGFEMLDVVVRDKGWGCQVIYSDGLYAISVFSGELAERAGDRMRDNAVYDWGQGLATLKRVRGGGFLVLADLPGVEIEKIAGCLR